MAKSLFVGNLPWSVTEDEIKSKFEENVKVLSTRIIMDKLSGKSRGFGFVDVEDSDVEKAISSMNGVKLGERELVVNEARKRV